jgi:UDP-3-O-[3-hydroxymyristoyl] glucosamine N-acyltransferase
MVRVTSLFKGSFVRAKYIGSRCEIGKFCIIEPGVVISDWTNIGDYVRLGSDTYIESGVVIDHYVRSSGLNRIGQGVVVRYGCTLARNLVIGKNSFLAPHVSTIYAEGKDTIIEPDVFIGSGAVIDAGVRIKSGVVIGAMSFVKNDCLEPGLYVGQPARRVKNVERD